MEQVVRVNVCKTSSSCVGFITGSAGGPDEEEGDLSLAGLAAGSHLYRPGLLIHISKDVFRHAPFDTLRDLLVLMAR